MLAKFPRLLQDEEAEVLRRCVWTPKKIDCLSGIAIKQVEPHLNQETLHDETLHLISELPEHLEYPSALVALKLGTLISVQHKPYFPGSFTGDRAVSNTVHSFTHKERECLLKSNYRGS